MRTLLLDLDTWDLCLDSAGQIKVTSGAYAIAQNVANAIRLFTNDAWFNPERGVPHFDLDLAVRPSLAVIRNRYRQAALSIDGVIDADVQIYGVQDRKLTGNIKLTLSTGETADVSI